MQAFDGIADGVEQVVAGQGDEVAPGEPGPLAGEDAVVLLAPERRDRLILLREQAQE